MILDEIRMGNGAGFALLFVFHITSPMSDFSTPILLEHAFSINRRTSERFEMLQAEFANTDYSGSYRARFRAKFPQRRRF